MLPPLTAFGCGHCLPCCPLSTAFEATTRAYRHLANRKRDRQTDEQTDRSTALFPLPSGGHVGPNVMYCNVIFCEISSDKSLTIISKSVTLALTLILVDNSRLIRYIVYMRSTSLHRDESCLVDIKHSMPYTLAR